MAEVDCDNRDPRNINDGIKVMFEDILAEPEGAHSMACVWKASFACFNGCKNLCYMLYTTLCGIFIACGWGMEFAAIAFVHVWWVTPCMKNFEINCGCLQRCFGYCLNCCLQPVCDVYATFFSKIIVTNK